MHVRLFILLFSLNLLWLQFQLWDRIGWRGSFLRRLLLFLLFFGVNKRAAKTSQCTGTKLGTQIGYSNLTCNVILILLPYHLPP